MSNDVLTLTSGTAIVLARYSEDYYSGAPALVRNGYGEGTVYYYGAGFNDDVVNVLIDQCGMRSPADGVITLPPDVELCIRRHPATEVSFWFLLNFAASPQHITVRGTHVDILTGKSETGNVTIEPFGVMILSI
jgi:beta-galactosidase